MRVLVAIAVMAVLFVLAQGVPPATAGEGLNIDAVIWQFDRDYPGADWNDSALPVRTVYIKTHDGVDWMSTYDQSPLAITGTGRVGQIIDLYGQQRINVVAWFVPKGPDVETQLRIAEEVIDSGVSALYADIESFQGFCEADCAYLAQTFWWRLRAERPNATLGVMYVPLSSEVSQSDAPDWLRAADVAAPQCYWDTYAGQPPWDDPAGCITEAHKDLGWIAPGQPLDYVPMLQGNSSADRFTAAAIAAQATGASRVSVWRRGLVSREVWDAAATLTVPEAPPAPEVAASPPSPQPTQTPVDSLNTNTQATSAGQTPCGTQSTSSAVVPPRQPPPGASTSHIPDPSFYSIPLYNPGQGGWYTLPFDPSSLTQPWR